MVRNRFLVPGGRFSHRPLPSREIFRPWSPRLVSSIAVLGVHVTMLCGIFGCMPQPEADDGTSAVAEGVDTGGSAVVAKASIQAESIDSPAQAALAPPTASSLTIAFTGADLGILEPCGCTKGMLGGIGRRAAFIAAILPPGCRGLVLGTGGLAGRVDKSGKVIALDLLRYETLLVALNEMGYQAVGLGPEELGLGLERLRAAREIVDFPFVLTNVTVTHSTEKGSDDDGSDDWSPPFDAVHRITVAGDWDRGGGREASALSVRLFGIIAPLRSAGLEAAGLRVEAPCDALKRAVAGSPDADLNVVLVYGSRDEARELSTAVPDPGLIIYSRPGAEPQIFDFGRKEGPLRLLSAGDRGRFVGLCTVTAGVDQTVTVTEARFEALDDSMLESDIVGFALLVYRERIRLEKILEQMVDQEPHPTGDRYAGSAACRECHPRTHAIFAGSRHAGAFTTLAAVKRDYDPGCIACHVVGFGYRGGFQSTESTPGLLGVGCEACHGPAGAHVEGGPPPDHRVECESCHDRHHSPGFDREAAWKKITCIQED